MSVFTTEFKSVGHHTNFTHQKLDPFVDTDQTSSSVKVINITKTKMDGEVTLHKLMPTLKPISEYDDHPEKDQTAFIAVLVISVFAVCLILVGAGIAVYKWKQRRQNQIVRKEQKQYSRGVTLTSAAPVNPTASS